MVGASGHRDSATPNRMRWKASVSAMAPVAQAEHTTKQPPVRLKRMESMLAGRLNMSRTTLVGRTLR